MLAAAISESEEASEPVSKTKDMIKLPRTIISTDDVLDIKVAVNRMKFSAIKGLANAKARKRTPITISRVPNHKN